MLKATCRWLNACPWNVRASTECGQIWSCAGPWSPLRAMWCMVLLLSFSLGSVAPLCVSPRAAVTCHSTSLWELTGECVIGPWGALEDVKWSGASNGDDGTDRGAKGIAAPEVKFLDRRRTNCSEGVLQVRVRRSRMRVWGAKMIRHRRSPAP